MRRAPTSNLIIDVCVMKYLTLTDTFVQSMHRCCSISISHKEVLCIIVSCSSEVVSTSSPLPTLVSGRRESTWNDLVRQQFLETKNSQVSSSLTSQAAVYFNKIYILGPVHITSATTSLSVDSSRSLDHGEILDANSLYSSVYNDARQVW